MSRCLTRSNIILGAIIALAAFFRLYQLDQLPPGLQFDQAFYIADAIRLLQGEFHIFFVVPGGTEPLYPYLAMVGVALFGDSGFGLRLTGAMIGILTVPIVYGSARAIFGSTRIGLIAAFLTAISLWHIFFNRYGERVSLLVLFTALIFWFFWQALQTQSRRYYLLTGLFTALALYTYPGSRVLPFALILLAVYTMIDDRKNARQYFVGLLIALALAAILISPLAIYFLLHPDQFSSHSLDVSIFVPHGTVTDPGTALINNALRILGMFFVAGDGGVLRNPIPSRPIFDPLLGSLFVIGVIAWLITLFSPRSDCMARRRAVLLFVWIASILSISLITDDAPNFVRTLPALPVVMMLPAWGANEIWKRLSNSALRRTVGVVFAIILLFSTGLAYRDYFIVFAESPDTYYTFDTDKVELAQWLNQQTRTQQIFIAPLLAQNGTISLLTRNSPIKTFESRDTIILPTRGQDALFVFPWEQSKKVDMLTERLGKLGAREEITGSNGGKLAIVYRIPANNLPNDSDLLATLARGGDFIQPQKIIHAPMGDSIEVLGYSLAATDMPKRNLEVTVFFRALKTMNDDYTFSIKARDDKDRTWGQEDKWAGDNSYATTQWSVGDLVIEKFYPGLSACAPEGDYHISIEAYKPQTMQALGVIDLGTWQASASQSNRLEDLEPEHPLDLAVAPQTRLLGYTLSPEELHPGDPFSLSLFWRGTVISQSSKISVRLRDAQNHEWKLDELNLITPLENRGLCIMVDQIVPSKIAIGRATFWLNDLQIRELEIR